MGMAAPLEKLRRYRPREAAVAIVNYVNHRNPNVSMLALNVCFGNMVIAGSLADDSYSYSIYASRIAATLSTFRSARRNF
jgi:hypothetical protein